MKVHVVVGCVFCLVSFAPEGGAWFWPFGKAKDEKPKVDGGWSPWGPWSSCLEEENPPYRERKRNCTNPAPQNGGSTCEGVATKTSSCKKCSRALGFENGKIKDSQISSPSAHREFPAFNGRLHGGSSWCANIQDDEIYLQVDLQNLTAISAIATEGFYPDPKVMSIRRGRVSKYELTYSQDGLSWERYRTVTGNTELPGNKARLGTVTNRLNPLIKARYVRVYPLGFYSFMCTRMELYGCPVTCGGRLSEHPGSLDIRSSEAEEKDCLWLVDLPNVQKIHFDFVNFDVPCDNGEVVIRDGLANYQTAPVLGRYCDLEATPPQVIGSTGKLWVHFKSNSSDPHVGFFANYFPGCGGHLESSEGILESPNYPKNYFQNSKCTWTIAVPEGKAIHLTFSHFDVDGDMNRHRCPSDHVTIWDGVSSGLPVLGRFCNSNLPPTPICSSNNTLKLRFRADEVVARTGFLARFRAVEPNACFVSSSPPTMPITSSLSSHGAIQPSTSANLLIAKTTPFTTAFTTATAYTVLPSVGQPNITIAAQPQMSTVIPSIGSMGRNFSANEDPKVSANRKDDDDDDDDEDDLTTIIIISAFGFVVVCLIIASIVPGIRHNCEKRNREKSISLGVEIGAQRNSSEPQYDEDFQGEKESCVFLPKETDSQVFSSQDSMEELPPEYEVESVLLKTPGAGLPSMHSETDCFTPSSDIQTEPDPGDTPVEGDFHISCQDLSTSFALEMQAMMSKLINTEDDALEMKNAHSLSRNSRNSTHERDSPHGSRAGDSRQSLTKAEQPEVPISNTATGNGQHGCGEEAHPPTEAQQSLCSVSPSPTRTGPENCSTQCADQPAPWHAQPNCSSNSGTQAPKPKGTSASSYAESKDSGCASSMENLHDTETCL